MNSRLLGAVGWLCLAIAGISFAMLLLTFLSQPGPARDVAALGLVAAALSGIGFAALRRVQVGRAELPRLGLPLKKWLVPALVMGFTFGVLTTGYEFIQVHGSAAQALGGGLLAAIMVFAATSLGFSRPQNTAY